MEQSADLIQNIGTQRQNRHGGQYGDHGDVLEQQHVETPLTGCSAQLTNLAQRLQRDGGRGQGQG